MGLLFKHKDKTNDAPTSKIENARITAYKNCFMEFINVFPLYIALNKAKDAKAEEYHKRALQLLVNEPELVHFSDSDGKNIVEIMVSLRMMGYFLNILSESYKSKGAGIIDLCVRKYGEKEPACFAVLQSTIIDEIKAINAIITAKGLDPVNADGKKWSKLYQEKIKEVEYNSLRNEKIFKENRKPVLDSLKAVHQEEQGRK